MNRITKGLAWLTFPAFFWAAESATAQPEVKVVVKVIFVEINQDSVGEYGFDWLFNPAPSESAETENAPASKEKKKSKHREKAELVASSYGFHDEKATVTGEDAIPKSRGGVTIAGVFTDPQFQLVARTLDQKKGIDLISAPTIRTRSGEAARIQIIRSDLAPLGFPEVITEKIKTRKHGVELLVEPTVGEDGLTIDLNLMTEVIKFEGFINYGSPVDAGAGKDKTVVAEGDTTVQVGNQIVMPVFETRKGKTQVTIWDGQTVALSGIVRKDTLVFEKRVPLLGDLPLLGKVFRQEGNFTEARNLTMFVTAKLVRDGAAEK